MLNYNQVLYENKERNRELRRKFQQDIYPIRKVSERRFSYEKLLGVLGELLIITGQRLKQAAALPVAE